MRNMIIGIVVVFSGCALFQPWDMGAIDRIKNAKTLYTEEYRIGVIIDVVSNQRAYWRTLTEKGASIDKVDVQFSIDTPGLYGQTLHFNFGIVLAMMPEAKTALVTDFYNLTENKHTTYGPEIRQYMWLIFQEYKRRVQ